MYDPRCGGVTRPIDGPVKFQEHRTSIQGRGAVEDHSFVIAEELHWERIKSVTQNLFAQDRELLWRHLRECMADIEGRSESHTNAPCNGRSGSGFVASEPVPPSAFEKPVVGMSHGFEQRTAPSIRVVARAEQHRSNAAHRATPVVTPVPPRPPFAFHHAPSHPPLLAPASVSPCSKVITAVERVHGDGLAHQDFFRSLHSGGPAPSALFEEASIACNWRADATTTCGYASRRSENPPDRTNVKAQLLPLASTSFTVPSATSLPGSSEVLSYAPIPQDVASLIDYTPYTSLMPVDGNQEAGSFAPHSAFGNGYLANGSLPSCPDPCFDPTPLCPAGSDARYGIFETYDAYHGGTSMESWYPPTFAPCPVNAPEQMVTDLEFNNTPSQGAHGVHIDPSGFPH
ncbi:unnamed protein product [Peniophora sp. CBMAI 1063]|nr:unnamed protein product [Peniophora sp. CBMAI 1063]